MNLKGGREFYFKQTVEKSITFSRDNISICNFQAAYNGYFDERAQIPGSDS